MLETTRGRVVDVENMPAVYQRCLDVLHLYIQQNRISLAYQRNSVCNENNRKVLKTMAVSYLLDTYRHETRVSVDTPVTHLSFGAWPAHGCLGKEIPPRRLGVIQAKKKVATHRASSANRRVGLGSAVSLAPN